MISDAWLLFGFSRSRNGRQCAEQAKSGKGHQQYKKHHKTNGYFPNHPVVSFYILRRKLIFFFGMIGIHINNCFDSNRYNYLMFFCRSPILSKILFSNDKESVFILRYLHNFRHHRYNGTSHIFSQLQGCKICPTYISLLLSPASVNWCLTSASCKLTRLNCPIPKREDAKLVLSLADIYNKIIISTVLQRENIRYGWFRRCLSSDSAKDRPLPFLTVSTFFGSIRFWLQVYVRPPPVLNCSSLPGACDKRIPSCSSTGGVNGTSCRVMHPITRNALTTYPPNWH